VSRRSCPDSAGVAASRRAAVFCRLWRSALLRGRGAGGRQPWWQPPTPCRAGPGGAGPHLRGCTGVLQGDPSRRLFHGIASATTADDRPRGDSNCTRTRLLERTALGATPGAGYTGNRRANRSAYPCKGDEPANCPQGPSRPALDGRVARLEPFDDPLLGRGHHQRGRKQHGDQHGRGRPDAASAAAHPSGGQRLHSQTRHDEASSAKAGGQVGEAERREPGDRVAAAQSGLATQQPVDAGSAARRSTTGRPVWTRPSSARDGPPPAAPGAGCWRRSVAAIRRSVLAGREADRRCHPRCPRRWRDREGVEVAPTTAILAPALCLGRQPGCALPVVMRGRRSQSG
jgi:hypothetical protein